MPYIGRTPANAAITADDLDNGIVTADKLATNAVTTVKVNADAVTNAKTEFTPVSLCVSAKQFYFVGLVPNPY